MPPDKQTEDRPEPADWTQKVWKPGRHHNGVPDKVGQPWCEQCGREPKECGNPPRCPCGASWRRIAFP
jgi:hypothetical protein